MRRPVVWAVGVIVLAVVALAVLAAVWFGQRIEAGERRGPAGVTSPAAVPGSATRGDADNDEDKAKPDNDHDEDERR